MSINVAELLVKAKSAEKPTGKAPDPLVDPEGAISYHRSVWPLNQKVADGDLPATPEGSDRVRLRRAAEELEKCGVILNGGFAQHYKPSGNATMGGGFSGSGDLWSSSAKVTIEDSGSMEKDEMVALIQKVLQHWGFAMVATMNGDLAMAEAGNDKDVMWVEIDMRPGYGTSKSSKMTPALLLQYGRALSDMAVYGISEWAVSDFTPEQAKEWCQKGVRTPREADAWIDLGLDANGAKQWMAADVQVAQAESWIAAGYEPKDAKPWTAITRSFEQANEWIKEGYTPAQAGMWIGFYGYGGRGRGYSYPETTPNSVRILIDAKVGAKQLARLQAAGCDGGIIEPLVKWVGRYKIELAEALEWAELGPDFVGPGKRGRWHKAGFSPDDIRVWQKALSRRSITVDEVRAKIEAGFDPKQGAEWTVVCSRFSDPSLVASWTEAGMEPKDAEEWVRLSESFCHYSLVKGWKDAGFGVKEARRWVSANPSFTRYELVKEWEDADPRLAGQPEMVAELARITRPDTVRKTLAVLAKLTVSPTEDRKQSG